MEVPATFFRARYDAFSPIRMEITSLGSRKRYNTLAAQIFSRPLYQPRERTLGFSQERLSLCDNNEHRFPLLPLQILSTKDQLLTLC